MAQKIKQGNIFGRIGSGIGQGLAEQIPKEIERGRLASGLKELGERKDTDPWQNFAALASIPGITPQMIQTGGEILKQRGMLSGAQGNQKQAQQQFEEIKRRSPTASAEPAKGLVKSENTQAALEPAIPKNMQQLQNRAVELNQESPELYPDYATALQGAQMEDNQIIAQNNAQRAARESQKGVQGDIRNELRGLQSAANAKVPDNVYQKIENKALDAIRNGENELTATKNAVQELDKISRNYDALKEVGSVDFILRDKQDIQRNLKEIRRKFKDRDDLENYADSLIAEQKLSPGKAYYLAYPPSESKELNNALARLPDLNKIKSPKSNPNLTFEQLEKNRTSTIEKVMPQIAKAMGVDGSPLAIAEELEARGYDKDKWFSYLEDNRDTLNLTERQGRELGKPKPAIPNMNDTWLFLFSGLEKLVEQ